jgi:hypothetical protein
MKEIFGGKEMGLLYGYQSITWGHQMLTNLILQNRWMEVTEEELNQWSLWEC